MRGDQVSVRSVAYLERNAAPVSNDNRGVEFTREDGTTHTYWGPTITAAVLKAEEAGEKF